MLQWDPAGPIRRGQSGSHAPGYDDAGTDPDAAGTDADAAGTDAGSAGTDPDPARACSALHCCLHGPGPDLRV
jgi:hypothetical protein